MKEKLLIFTNLSYYSIYSQILHNYVIQFHPINSLTKQLKKNQKAIVLHKKNKEKYFEQMDNLKDIFLITNDELRKKNFKNFIYLKQPLSPSRLRDEINKFIDQNKFEFEDIIIYEKKIINNLTKNHTFLTDIEKEILVYLFKSKKCSKEFIKNNILKIKSTIETNSIDSHLTRIRKKLSKIKSNLIIKSKYDEVVIEFN